MAGDAVEDFGAGEAAVADGCADVGGCDDEFEEADVGDV